VVGHKFDHAARKLQFWMPYIPLPLTEFLSSPSFSPHSLILPDGETNKREDRFVILVKSIAFQIIAAIAYLHGQKIAHRDVKPHNARLTAEGCVKLFDFGISWTESEDLSIVENDIWPEYQEDMYCEVSTA
jgi:cyclin-dependent kinase 8/11